MTQRVNKFMTVIHAVNQHQAVENTSIAFENGADGVFLINHSVSVEKLQSIYRAVRRFAGEDKFIGVNFLGVDQLRAVSLLLEIPDASAIWMDDMGIVENGKSLQRKNIALEIYRKLKIGKYGGLFFGGIAFKYQKPVENLVFVTAAALSFTEVITTSGPATGDPPDIGKIKIIRGVESSFKLAVASGMTPENVDPFLDHVDYFLVATGVSVSFTELDSKRVRMFANKMRK